MQPREILKLKRARPIGLWNVRRVTSSRHSVTSSDSYFDHDDEQIWRKRARFNSPSTSATDSDEEIEYWDFSRQRSESPPLEECTRPALRSIVMDTSSTADQGEQTRAKSAQFTFEDWQDLKELFSKATEAYEVQEASEALPLLRGVIHECHRFLICYEDPSELFASPPHQSPPMQPSSPPELRADWSQLRRGNVPKPKQPIVRPVSPVSRKCKCVELPTAFHTLLGTTLFLFGNIISQEPELVLPGEPAAAPVYWLAALDVFETGENLENLPSRTDGRGDQAREDWRMAIVWGRTLICLADENVTREQKAKELGENTNTRKALENDFFASDDDEFSPSWPPESPFAAIASRRPPVARRTPLSESTPNDLMVLAMDQFSRGIFHMPHPQHSPSCSSSTGSASFPIHNDCFSRAKELFTIASEVLSLAERLSIPSERRYWASWADSVLNQMKMEAALDMWRGAITRARGRCWLVVGSSYSEDLEQALEAGQMDCLASDEATEARSGLEAAIKFFTRAKSFAETSTDPLDPDLHESRQLQPLLAEAYLSLANLTVDETKREELYSRAQAEGGDNFELDDEMDQS